MFITVVSERLYVWRRAVSLAPHDHRHSPREHNKGRAVTCVMLIDDAEARKTGSFVCLSEQVSKTIERRGRERSHV